MGRFFEVCKRRGLKINTGKRRVMVQNGEEGLECQVHVDGIHLEHISEFIYFGCVLDESDTGEAEYRRNVRGAIRSLVNARDLELQCATVLLETLVIPVLIDERETMLWKETERSRIRVVQMDNLRGEDERIAEGILQSFDHVERMENDRIAKSDYIGEFAGSC